VPPKGEDREIQIPQQGKKRLELHLGPHGHKLLADEIADTLREAIVSGQFQPGEKLKEDEIASVLEVSRTPIRQALKTLEFEGLVDVFPRRGAFVSRLTKRDAEELYQMLGMIEGFACTLLVVQSEGDLRTLDQVIIRAEKSIQDQNLGEVIKANLEFHQTIVEMAKNSRLFSTYMTVRRPTRILQSIGLSSSSDWKVSLQDHKRIVAAIRTGEAAEASQLCLEHNIKSCKRVLSRFSKVYQNT
jgi:DNA-binding GntR family transcriptional regulator